MNLQECDKMTIDAPTLDTITGHTVMVKMRELIKQMTTFAKEVADLVNTIPTDVQDTYSREAVDGMIQELDDAIDDITGDITTLMQDKANASDVYTKSEVYTKTETDELLSDKADTSDVYDKTETDELLSAKANASNVYTKSETDTLLSDKQDELTAGTGISINNNVISSVVNLPVITNETTPTYENIVQDGDIVILSGTVKLDSSSTEWDFSMEYIYKSTHIESVYNVAVYNNFYKVIVNTSVNNGNLSTHATVFNVSDNQVISSTITYISGKIIRSVA